LFRVALPLQALLTILDSPLNKAGKVKVSSNNSSNSGSSSSANMHVQQQPPQPKSQVLKVAHRWQ
jgi:hypothetical protein